MGAAERPSTELPLRLALGGVAGTIAQTVCQPLETVKVRLQNERGGAPQKYRNFVHGLGVVVRHEGLLGLYKGLFPAALRELSYSSLRFGLYVPIKRVLIGTDDGPTPFWKKLVAGGLAGGAGSAIANPSDLLKIRMQADAAMPPTSFAAHVRNIYASGGLAGFWTGVGGTVQRAVVLGATKLATYDESKIQLRARLGLEGLPLQTAAACAAGFAYVCTTAPLDMGRTRFMTAQQVAAATGAEIKYTSSLDAILQTLRAEGPATLYRGFFPQWARAAPYTVVQSLTWECLCKLCGTNAV